MRIDVSSKQMDITPAIQQHVEKKLGKVDRYYDGVQSVEAHLDTAPHGQFAVELRVEVEKHDTFVAKDSASDLYAAIDTASDKMVRQLTDFKEKLKNTKR